MRRQADARFPVRAAASARPAWDHLPLGAIVLGLAILTAAGCGPAAMATPLDDRGKPAEKPKRPAVDPATIAVETDLPELIAAHNRERAGAKERGEVEKELATLEADPLLTEAAAIHARDMAAHSHMAHEGSDGSAPADRVKRVGYKFQGTGENVAMGYPTVAQVMEGWMGSAGHRKNILGDFTQIGVARAEAADGTLYWAAEFGRPWPAPEPERAAAGLVAAINAARKEERKPALKVHPRLQEAAARHARENAQRGALEPKDDDGLTPLERVEKSGYRYRMLGQADAGGHAHAEEVLKTWLASESSRKQLMSPFSDIGAGYAADETGKPYWTIILGRRR